MCGGSYWRLPGLRGLRRLANVIPADGGRFGHAPSPRIAHRPSGLTASLRIALDAEADESNQRAEPQALFFDTRHQQPFKPFKPDTSFTSALVEFGAWHVLV